MVQVITLQNRCVPPSLTFRKSFSSVFFLCSSANDNKRRRKSEPATAQPRAQSSVGTTQTSVRPPELPKSSSTQKNPLTSPGFLAATRTKGRRQMSSRIHRPY